MQRHNNIVVEWGEKEIEIEPSPICELVIIWHFRQQLPAAMPKGPVKTSKKLGALVAVGELATRAGGATVDNQSSTLWTSGSGSEAS